MTRGATRVLLIGYGNPGRGDDGLGPAFANGMEAMGFSGVTVESDYQLTIEDAVTIADFDVVVFADADKSSAEPFYLYEIKPDMDLSSISSHLVTPQEVLGLAMELFGAHAKGYILGIRGYDFDEFKEEAQARGFTGVASGPYVRSSYHAEQLFKLTRRPKG